MDGAATLNGRHVWSLALVLVAVMCAFAPSTPCAAQEPTRANRREAERRFRSGVALYAEGDFAEALVEFEASYALRPTAVALYNAARVLSRLGRAEEAVERFERLLSEHSGELDREDAAEARVGLQRALRRLAHLTISATPSSASIVVGRRVVTSGAAVRLMPGRHEINVRADRHRTLNDSVELRAGERRTIEVRLEADRELASLDITSTPSSAEVTIDGRPTGRTPTGASLPLGGHHVRLELSGHYPVEQEVVLRRGELRVLDVALEPRRSLLERPWFWITISTVVIGTAATWIYLYESRTTAPAGTIGNVEID